MKQATDMYIHLKGIRLYAYHGVLPQENRVGTQYTIDLRLKTDFTLAAYRAHFHGYHLLRGDCGGLLRCASAARAQRCAGCAVHAAARAAAYGGRLSAAARARTEKSRRRMGARAF